MATVELEGKTMELDEDGFLQNPDLWSQTVAQYFDIALDDLLGKSREKKLAFPRQITMYLMRTELRSSFPTIGDELGGRDHTTAMHACDKIGKEIERDEKLRVDLAAIKERLFGNA